MTSMLLATAEAEQDLMERRWIVAAHRDSELDVQAWIIAAAVHAMDWYEESSDIGVLFS